MIFLQLNRPAERLFNGHIDKNKWFNLRYQTQQHLSQIADYQLRGLTGGRTSLIPHQLYIAHEIASRYAPRVLLADEVGLGKTIEAGMILHNQVLTEQARRVLIVVPDSLVHQWLVEMLRRFNLFFSVFDEERCIAIEESGEQDNPFDSEQLVLCSLSFLTKHPNRVAQSLATDWDMLIVDEAHHLQWSPENSSPEYSIIEQLAKKTKSVLLLTATPEQLGKASHFARLRLLDADRFHDFDAFLKEEESYEPVAEAIQNLFGDSAIDSATLDVLADTIEEGDNRTLIESLNHGDDEAQTSARLELIEHLLDRHGTGRVLFRNTRSAVKGFPERELLSYPLETPAEYERGLEDYLTGGFHDPQILLCPERLHSFSDEETEETAWTDFDPRISWLIDKLTELKPEKVLVIISNALSALDVADALKARSGIHAAVFHERLSIIERDRAAAFFADPEDGTQVLICSEIGSEGRNFQFSHHLILLDLPLNPDLLEQRIGRLDRIGQQHTIQIHVPYLTNHAQQTMFDWYHRGLQAFEHTCPAGHAVMTQVEEDLFEALYDAGEDRQPLIDKTRTLHEKLNAELHRGRDKLLEYNSCRPEVANQLIDRAIQRDANSRLSSYMDKLYDCFGVDSEIHSDSCIIISPGTHMMQPFPGLPDDGLTITYNRETALANEDVQYVSWDHPIVAGAMEMVLTGEHGNTGMMTVEYTETSPGTLLLESIFVLEAANVKGTQTNRYLPPTSIRIVVDETGMSHDIGLSTNFLSSRSGRVDADTAMRIVRAKEKELRKLIEFSEKQAQAEVPELLAEAHNRSKLMLSAEIDRLKALQKVNPSVRDEEIAYLEKQLNNLNQVLDSAHLRLDALRVIVST